VDNIILITIKKKIPLGNKIVPSEKANLRKDILISEEIEKFPYKFTNMN
jgi:hypothetical protein